MITPNPIIITKFVQTGKRAEKDENLRRFCAQFGMKPWHHTYAYWRSCGYDPKTTY